MIVCTQSESLVVASGCDCTTNWANSPGTCRLQITGYVNGVLTSCGGATASGLPGWPGTFPISSPLQLLADTTGVSISGHVFNGANITFTGGTHWVMSIVGDTLGAPNTMWTGTLNSTCPLGVYVRTDGCQPGPATFTVSAYTP